MTKTDFKPTANTKKAKLDLFSSAVEHNTGAPFWIVDGEPYDFTPFIPKHPGGSEWFLFNVRRDISVSIYTYHVDPAKILPIVAKYKITKDHPNYKECVKENVLPKLGVPPFLLPADYDARKDMPTFDFNNESHLLNVVRKQVKTPEFQKEVKRWNLLFDTVCVIALGLYALNTAAFMFDAFYLPTWVSVVGYALLRTSFGAFGHYYVHGKKPNVGDILFDAPYVGTSSVGMDGHVLLHHAYTHTGADVKTLFFNGIWSLPPFYRPIGYTFHKLGLLLSGMIIRIFEICIYEFGIGFFNPFYLIFRIWMVAEFWISYQNGKVVPFLAQFALTLWYNTFLILSSHDFEDFHDNPDAYHPDWGVFQIQNCHDMTIVFNKYLDMLLSAGLSSHRAHHLFPYQTSGFANLATERFIKKALPDFGLEWHKPKLWWTERFPYVFRFCFMHPTVGMEDMSLLRQHLSFTGVYNTIKFITTGFIGINAA